VPSTQPFQDVPVTEQGVDTAAFLEACEDVVKMFGALACLDYCRCTVDEQETQLRLFSFADLFGSPAFAIVQNDMNGNIKVRTLALCDLLASD
jgi:hypothetical protein